MITSGVNNITKFVQSSNKSFMEYVKYIDRDEAIRNANYDKYNAINYENYNHYMDNPSKTSGLFSATHDSLTKEQVSSVRKLFCQAQENGSIMWQDVISFDNNWLHKHGVYDPKTGDLDEGAIQKGIREGMSRMLKREDLFNTALWTASIHYNTDNIHVHIATVEPNPTRPIGVYKNKLTGGTYSARRGKRKLSSLDLMKQAVASNILDRHEQMTELTRLIRNELSIANQEVRHIYDRELRASFIEIYKELPSDKRLWKYNNQALKSTKPKIDKFITNYIEKYQYESLQEVDKLIDDEIKTIEETYGKGSKQANRSEDYRQTKYHEIYTRMGNQLLREMKQFDKERYLNKENKSSYSTKHSVDKALKSLNKLLNPKKNYKNQRIYRELQENNQQGKEQDYQL
ncbi:MAG: MobP2 family relaxase [Vagococcus sp.]